MYGMEGGGRSEIKRRRERTVIDDCHLPESAESKRDSRRIAKVKIGKTLSRGVVPTDRRSHKVQQEFMGDCE